MSQIISSYDTSFYKRYANMWERHAILSYMNKQDFMDQPNDDTMFHEMVELDTNIWS